MKNDNLDDEDASLFYWPSESYEERRRRKEIAGIHRAIGEAAKQIEASTRNVARGVHSLVLPLWIVAFYASYQLYKDPDSGLANIIGFVIGIPIFIVAGIVSYIGSLDKDTVGNALAWLGGAIFVLAAAFDLIKSKRKKKEVEQSNEPEYE